MGSRGGDCTRVEETTGITHGVVGPETTVETAGGEGARWIADPPERGEVVEAASQVG